MPPWEQGGGGRDECHADVRHAIGAAVGRLERDGHPPVVLCSSAIRAELHKIVSPHLPEAAVIGFNEIQSVRVESKETITSDIENVEKIASYQEQN